MAGAGETQPGDARTTGRTTVTAGRRGATIREVANRAGVSIKTVSRVVNNEPNVRPETRKRVQEAVSALDYEPLPAARGLAGRRTFSIGLLYENPHEFSYIQRLLEGAYAACEASSHALLLRPCPPNLTTDMVRQFVRQTRIDGLLLTAPITDRSDVTSLLVEAGVAFAQISPRETNPDWTSVSPDDVEASRVLTGHVIDLGHRRVGFIQGDPHHGASHKRLVGHLACLRERGLTSDPALIVEGQFDFDSGKRGFSAMRQLDEPPHRHHRLQRRYRGRVSWLPPTSGESACRNRSRLPGSTTPPPRPIPGRR